MRAEGEIVYMNTKLTEKCFKGMNGAYAALFTPYDEKGRG